MDLSPWLPSVATTGLFAAALWLARKLIVARLARSIEHEFNAKLEALRTQFREGEERLRADLRAREAELGALRSGALSALASRQAALDKRRLEAVDQLWAAVTALAPARTIAMSMSVFNFKLVAARAAHDPKLRSFFETIGAGFDQKNLDLSGAAKARPFVNPMVWAVFSAIQAIIFNAVMRWQVVRAGLGPEDFARYDVMNGLIKSVLPNHANYVDEHGPDGYFHLLEALDSRLLAEIQTMLSGVQADKESVDQAAEILRRAEDLMKQGRPSDGA
jgi:hypothetical protein